MSKEQTLSVPIISDILKLPIPRGKVLVLLYEPSAEWLSLILTSALELLRRGYSVVRAPAYPPPPSQHHLNYDAIQKGIKRIGEKSRELKE